MSNETPSTTELIFKIASEDWEFEQIHRLNYRTFVDEIPQHAPIPRGVWWTVFTRRTRI